MLISRQTFYWYGSTEYIQVAKITVTDVKKMFVKIIDLKPN